MFFSFRKLRQRSVSFQERVSSETLDFSLRVAQCHCAEKPKTAGPQPLHAVSRHAGMAHVLSMAFNGFGADACPGVRGDKTEPPA
jgi:hypothetical protein